MATGMAGRAREWLVLLLVLAAAAWLHGDALRAPFFADDYLFLDQARGRSLAATLAAPDPLGNYFRPIGRQVWFWCLATASGESPRAFHLANLALFLAAVALLFAIARRWLGAGPALVAAGLLALSYAADVPVMWASGSQDLLAVVGALATVLLFTCGRRGWAALTFILALLAKEIVTLTPLVAIFASRRRGEPWRAALARAWPLFTSLGLWGAVWIHSHRPATGLDVHLDLASGIPATLVHLVQTIAGVEWPHEGPRLLLKSLPPPALLLVAGALFVATRGGVGARRMGVRSAGKVARGQPAGEARHAAIAGAAWALLGALPVIAVAGIWSAYYYLFSICGAALAIAALLASWPWQAALIPLVVFGWTAENVRRMPEFATARGPWTVQSHLNRHYLERGMSVAMRYLADLERQRPRVPAGSTLFFAGVPAQVGFQTADGPLVRWAYRDSSLRSHFLTRFRLAHAERGPLFFFQVRHDSLVEITGSDSLVRIGLGLVISGAPEAARDVFTLALRRDPGDLGVAYRLGLVEIALGHPDAARDWLLRCGFNPDPGPAPEVAAALARWAARDTARAIALAQDAVRRHALDAGAHALLADLLLLRPSSFNGGVSEAFAARALAPTNPSMWRRWGIIAVVQNRNDQAKEALERYFALAGEEGRRDVEALGVLRDVRRRLPGGDLAQEELKKARPGLE